MDQVADMVAWGACAGVLTFSVYEKNGLYIFYLGKEVSILTKLSRHFKTIYANALPSCY